MSWLSDRRARRDERDDDWVLISIANGANKFHRIHRYDNYGPAWRLVAALDRLQTRGMVQRDPEDGWHLTDIGWQALEIGRAHV